MSHIINNTKQLADIFSKINPKLISKLLRILNTCVREESKNAFLYTQCHYPPSRNELLKYLKTIPTNIALFNFLVLNENVAGLYCNLLSDDPSYNETSTHIFRAMKTLGG